VNPSPDRWERTEGCGRLLVFFAALFWSLAGIFIKFLDLHPLTIVFYRSLFASLVFLPFLKRTEVKFDSSIIISVLSYSAAITAFVSANKLTTAANAIVLQYTAPVFVFLFSRFLFGERISQANGLALTLSMIGVAVIAFDSAGEPAMSGVLLAILSGLLFAVYMVNLQQIKAAAPTWLTCINNGACALLILPFVSSRLMLTIQQLWIVALMGGVQLGLPYFLFSKGLRSISFARGRADRTR
jgi:drug/metabolite transporter (DMT)-like permease